MKIMLYDDLASWWPLLSPPADYVEEAGIYRDAVIAHAAFPPESLLELGSGGGNNAFHLKRHFDVTLVDLSPGMIDVSRALNPRCRHIVGDMRTVRLDETFDAVFIHDAICYMTALPELRQAIETAFLHCRPGGVAVFAPDYVRENFQPSTDCGGHDGGDRSLRYLEWTWDPDPSDDTYTVDYAYMLRTGDEPVQVRHERHIEGLFGTQSWIDVMKSTGFQPVVLPFDHSEHLGEERVFFAAQKPLPAFSLA